MWAILCEGARDKAFFRHLIQTRNLPEFRVTYPTENALEGKQIETGGRDGFASALRAFRVASDWTTLSALLVVSDNDDDPAASFRAVQQQIAAAGVYGVPHQPLQVAQAVDAPAVVVLMLPWAGERGSLDTLCLQPMYDNWPAGKRCLDEFCACASVNGWASESKRSKLRVQVMLSAMCPTDPNTTLRYAWSGEGRGNPIPLQHGAFDRIFDFLGHFGNLVGAP